MSGTYGLCIGRDFKYLRVSMVMEFEIKRSGSIGG